MAGNDKLLWDGCLKTIKEAVTEQQYNTWFAPIVFESFNSKSKTLILQVPNNYVCEYVEQNYCGLLSTVLKRYFGNEVMLKYRLRKEQQNEEKQIFETPQQAPAPTLKPVATTGATAGPTPTVRRGGMPAERRTAQEQPDGTLAFESQLDRRQNFNTYIEGASNKLPRTVGINIAEHPGRSMFNPLFVYGPSGCGKTHLINAIGVKCQEIYPNKRILYVSARLFQVQFTDAVRQNTTNDFIKFYQSIDVLIVDDIQEWATATRTLDTFFHIFNHLFRNGKQIVLASDRPPVELEGLKDRLMTRFCCGMIAELEKPNEGLCLDILRSKCHREGLNIAENVILYIAKTANGSVRDLSGVINSLLAYSVVYNCDIDMKLAERVIKRAVKIDNKPLTVDDILEKVCTHYNINQQHVMSKSRRRDVVNVRQISMYLAQKYTKMPASRIGQLIGNRDHSTVIHSCSTVEKKLKTDKAFSEEMTKIEASFKLKK